MTTDTHFQRTATSAHVVSRGVLWKFGSQATVQIFGFAVSLGVARLLEPAEYGAAALALALSAFAIIFSDLTLGAALVQRRVVGQAEASALFWFAFGLGSVVSAAFALAAPALASLVGNPDVRPLLLGVAPVFLISTAGAVPTALLNRRMQFRTLELRMIAATVISAVAALGIAFAGGGAWALVGQQLVQVGLLTSLAWVAARWLPSLTFSRDHLRDVAPFGLYASGSRAFGALSANADTLLVGRFLGTVALGAYAIAYNVLLIPLTRIAGPVREISFPTFSALDNPAAVGRLWLRANRVLFAALAPVLLALAVEATDFVSVLLGDRWEAAGPVLRLLALGGLMQVVYAMETGVMQACGRQRLQFLFAGARAVVLVAAFAIGLRWGIDGVAAGYTIGEAVMVPFGILAACRATGLPVRAVGTSLRPVVAAGVVMAGAMIALRGWTSLSGLTALVLVPAAGVAVYVALLAWWAHDLKVDSLNLARSLVKAPKS
jgi:O-antigen/teichoic acid export membrane protein